MRFRLKKSSHSQAGKQYHAGVAGQDIITTHLDLVALFGKGKFERLEELAAAPAAPVADEDDEPVEDATEQVGPLGVDVTAEYAVAAELDLLVYQNGKKYNVATTDAPTTALNEVELGKKALLDFLSKKAAE